MTVMRTEHVSPTFRNLAFATYPCLFTSHRHSLPRLSHPYSLSVCSKHLIRHLPDHFLRHSYPLQLTTTKLSLQRRQMIEAEVHWDQSS